MLYPEISLKHGYGEEFGHSLGHGIGLDIHEGPLLSKMHPVNFKLITVTIEPGIYVDGLGGVRIEDDILMTENGCEVFTKCTKDLIKISVYIEEETE